MKHRLSVELVYQIFSLLVAVIIVHAVYVGAIRPMADADQQQREEQLAENPDATPPRSIWIIIGGYEQEICFILMFWAMAILGFKTRGLLRERALLDQTLLPLASGESILPEDARSYARSVEALDAVQRDYLYPRALLTALQRFRATRSVQDVSEAVDALCETENDRLDSELSMIRYIAWAIPSIGFIGTVRGIGDALGLAHRAVEGDITGVTAALGVAFNSTLIALVLSIVLMFLLHQITLLQERLVLDTHAACDRQLIQNLQSG